MSQSDQLVASSFVRVNVLANPKISLEQIQEKWGEAGGSKSKKFALADIYSAKSMLRAKYGVASFEEIPRKPNGNLNLTKLIGALIAKKPNISSDRCYKSLESDGIKCSKSLIVKALIDSKAGNVEKQKSTKTRITKVRKSRVKSVKGFVEVRTLPDDKVDILPQLFSMEAELDKMIGDIDESTLTIDLRNARRLVSRAILART